MSFECEHSFSLYMAGAEMPIWRKVLVEQGAVHVALSFLNLRDRLPRSLKYDLAKKFPGPQEILVDSGGYGASRKEVDHELHVNLYHSFVEDNIDRLSLVTEYDPKDWPLDQIQYHRDEFWSQIPRAKFVPIWHEEHGIAELERLCYEYVRVGIVKPERNIEGKLHSLAVSTGVKFHGVAITGPDDLRRLPLTTASSTSWTSPRRFGDFQAWAGGQLKWYPKASKKAARGRHAMDIRHAGFSPEKIAAEDLNEISAYTVWVWKQYEAEVSFRKDSGQPLEVVDQTDAVDQLESSNGDLSAVDHQPPRRGTELVKREERVSFPLLVQRAEKNTNPQDGDPDMLPVTVLGESGLRRCNSCSLSRVCPAYTPDAECAYKLTAEIKTAQQLVGTLLSVMEMQTTRVAWAKAVEDSDGGPADPIVSAEMDRLFTMAKTLKDIQTDSAFLKIEAKGSDAPGMISRLFAQFGQDPSQVGKQVRERQRVDPVVAEAQVQDFIEGEIVDD